MTLEGDYITKKKPKMMVLHLADAAITDEVLHNLMLFRKLFPACEKLNRDFDVEVVGRAPEDAFRRACDLNLVYRDFFSSGAFSKEVTDKDIEEAENFVGIPFNYLFFSNKRRWSSVSEKDYKRKITRYVWAWKEMLRDADVVINYMENLFFTNLADLVADKMGVKIIKVAGSGIVANGLILWDKNHIPIFYKEKYRDDILENLLQRTTKKQQTVKMTNPVNRLQDILRKIPVMLKRARIRITDKRTGLDVDIPSFWLEFSRVTCTALRYLTYPRIHALFFDRSREGESFFLYPLHFQWEAQITLREPFLNQLGFAKQISKALPHNTYLYVKVHPHWGNADQNLLPAWELRREKNVRIIGPKEKTMDLIKKSLGVVVVNSTVGYEALIFGKPLIVTGHEVYREVGIDIKDLNEMPATLSMIKNGEYKTDTESYHEFLKKYSSHAITSEDPDVISKEISEAAFWCLKGTDKTTR
jgi:hypothetical protein